MYICRYTCIYREAGRAVTCVYTELQQSCNICNSAATELQQGGWASRHVCVYMRYILDILYIMYTIYTAFYHSRLATTAFYHNRLATTAFYHSRLTTTAFLPQLTSPGRAAGTSRKK